VWTVVQVDSCTMLGIMGKLNECLFRWRVTVKRQYRNASNFSKQSGWGWAKEDSDKYIIPFN
jgi:hypothetical protein